MRQERLGLDPQGFDGDALRELSRGAVASGGAAKPLGAPDVHPVRRRIDGAREAVWVQKSFQQHQWMTEPRQPVVGKPPFSQCQEPEGLIREMPAGGESQTSYCSPPSAAGHTTGGRPSRSTDPVRRTSRRPRKISAARLTPHTMWQRTRGSPRSSAEDIPGNDASASGPDKRLLRAAGPGGLGGRSGAKRVRR